MAMNESLEFLKSLNIDNNYIIVGCSSGPDSMCLLHLLHNNGYKVVCAHVNHKIREESDEEYEYLEAYCKNNNIIFEGLVLKKENNSESYYRKKRYDFYKSLADKYHTKYIATAHHGDDLIETVLMRITRGSNLKGYIGFSNCYVEKEYCLIKPLIYYTKDEILTYNKDKKIKYFEDITNKSDKYTRNRYRKEILPFLKSENPRVHKKYLEFSNSLNKINVYIKRITEDAIKDNYHDGIINVDKFNQLDNVIKEYELEMILSDLYGDDIDRINSKHIRDIIKLVKGRNNFSINLPNDYIVTMEYNNLYIDKKRKSKKDYIIKIDDKIELPNGYIIKKVSNSNDKSNYTIRLNSEEVKLPLYVRCKKEHDKISVKNMAGSKSIKKIFIDEKIPKSIRDDYPIVVNSSDEVIWIPGIKKSKFDSEINKKYDIILRYEREEDSCEK